MQWIIQLIVRNRTLSALCCTLFLSLWMISGTPGRQAAVARALTLTVLYPLQFVVNQATHINNVFSENKVLRQDVALLRTQASVLEEAAQENDRLIELIKFEKALPFDLLPVKVVAADPSIICRSVVVNAGKNRGICEYVPFITARGVAGKVVQVLPRLCVVQLLRDPLSEVSVMARRSRETGILESDDGNSFFVRYRAHADVAIGDVVVTSGLGGIFPKGLLIGEVVGIDNGTDPLFIRVSVLPSVDFDHLEEGFIMRLAPQWTAFHNELDSTVFDR